MMYFSECRNEREKRAVWPLRVLIGAIAFAIGAGTAADAGAAGRVALVIGNSAYRHAEELPNPRNDANALAEVLTRTGFEVDLKTDLDQLGMQHALRDFGLKAEAADVALVYYAGHGVQVAGENYLLPIDATLERERDLLYEALPLNLVMGEVAQAQKLGLVILDACRDNPLAEQLRRTLGPIRSRLVGDGLARMENLPSDTMIAFATRPGEVAVDGSGQHSPYAAALLEHIEEPGVELNLLFRKVRDSVLVNTAYRQEPRTYDALGADPFYFIEPKPNQRPELPRLAALEVLDDAGATPLGIGRPMDPDDDPLTVEVSGLPVNGTVRIGDQEVSIGDVLTADQLTRATYSPLPGATGEAGSFAFLLRDDRGGTTLGRVSILVERSNKAPVVETTSVLTLPAIPLNIRPPVDPDGDALTITVAEIPEKGAIKDGDRAVEVGEELSAQALAGLVLEPGIDGASGSFAFKVTDTRGASATSAMRIDVPGLAATAMRTAPVTEQPAPAPAAEAATEAAPDAASAPEVQTAMVTPLTEPAEPPAAATAPAPEESPPAAEPAETGRNFAVVPRAEPEPPSAEMAAIVGNYETIRTSNIRRGPSAETERVATVRQGTMLRVVGLAEGRDWYEVETPDGARGFIYGQLITPKEEPAPPAATEEPPAQVEQVAAPVTRMEPGAFKDCEACPELVNIPAGSFAMGSDDGHWSERPVHRVTIEEPFLLGKYEVTVGQWQACVDAGACASMPAMQNVSDSSPVHNISWNEVQNYLKWLSQQAGKTYRLPTEAEWEYAARAGTKTRYWWGETVGARNANCEDCGGSWDRKTPAVIGSFEANPFGLHDMNGGVMEWIADCWTQDYEGAPRDGSAKLSGDCSQHVLRGGSWRNDQTYATVSSRLSYDASVRYYTNGFRVARDVE
jgi:formylglycine-generating enzyme required for sulfatase activity